LDSICRSLTLTLITFSSLIVAKVELDVCSDKTCATGRASTFAVALPGGGCDGCLAPRRAEDRDGRAPIATGASPSLDAAKDLEMLRRLVPRLLDLLRLLDLRLRSLDLDLRLPSRLLSLGLPSCERSARRAGERRQAGERGLRAPLAAFCCCAHA
jgi:hypothetical protein